MRVHGGWKPVGRKGLLLLFRKECNQPHQQGVRDICSVSQGLLLACRPGSEVGFPGPWRTQQDNVTSFLQVRARGQMRDDIASRCELEIVIEIFQQFHAVKTSGLNPDQ